MNPVNLFLLISAFQGFILGFLIIFSPYFKSKTNNYLGTTIVILSLLMFNIFLSNIMVFDNYPALRIINNIEWVFLFPAVFFFYILNVINHNLLKNNTLKWLYLPIAVSIIMHLVKNLERDYSLYTITFHSKDVIYDLVFGLEELSSYVFNIVLMTWSYIVIKKSLNKKNTNIKWLKNLWFFVALMIISWTVLFIVDVFLIENYPVLDHYIIYDLYILAIELSIFVYWVAYHGIYKLKLANQREEILEILNKNAFNIQNNNKLVSSNNFSENNAYFLELETLLQKQFIYRDPDLSRELVAEKIGISSGYLSQIVNTITQKNFSAYINSYRIEEAKHMLLNEQFDKYSLLSIGLESGFKSKTTFYNSFKKETGCTPSEFKNKHK